MKEKYWRILVALVTVIGITSYLLLFRSDIKFESIMGLPAKFVIGIVITVFLVLLTFLGQSVFPYSDLNSKEDE